MLYCLETCGLLTCDQNTVKCAGAEGGNVQQRDLTTTSVLLGMLDTVNSVEAVDE